MKLLFVRDCFTVSLLIFLLLNFTGCGDNVEIVEYKNEELIESQSNESEVESEPSIEGTYYFKDGGILEVTTDSRNRVSVKTLDRVTSINPKNSTYAEHPAISINSRYLTMQGFLVYSTNVNYDREDLEEDTTGDNIRGRKRTDYTLTFTDNKLTLRIVVFQNVKGDNINFIILDRTLEGVL
jgi:hypothetical protein